MEDWWTMIERIKVEETRKSTDLSNASKAQKSTQKSRWRREESEHWNWSKKLEREDWESKMIFEDYKLWSWFPDAAWTVKL